MGLCRQRLLKQAGEGGSLRCMSDPWFFISHFNFIVVNTDLVRVCVSSQVKKKKPISSFLAKFLCTFQA